MHVLKALSTMIPVWDGNYKYLVKVHLDKGRGVE